jgi:hypothetical protein
MVPTPGPAQSPVGLATPPARSLGVLTGAQLTTTLRLGCAGPGLWLWPSSLGRVARRRVAPATRDGACGRECPLHERNQPRGGAVPVAALNILVADSQHCADNFRHHDTPAPA